MLRWLWDNISSLLLAFVLALTVWVAAVSAQDPIEERTLATPVAIEVVNTPDGLLIVEQAAEEARLRLRAPRSVWNQLTLQDVRVTADLSGLQAGTYQVPLEPSVEAQPVQVLSIEPARITVRLEPSASERLPVLVVTTGDPAIGLRAGTPQVDPQHTVVSGPTSAVSRVAEVRAQIDLSGRSQGFEEEVSLIPFDSEGNPVSGVQLEPSAVAVSIEIEELGGYRLVVVIPQTEGQVEPGYQVTQITVSPTLITVFSSDPQAVDELGGFVETEPVNLSGATEDIERRVSLNLPGQVSIVGNQSVVVRVSIAPIESSITITRRLEFQGLSQGLFARSSPEVVSLILRGPVPILDQLEAQDVRVVVDLFGLGIGTHQAEPQVIVAPTDVQVQTVLPDTVEVTITDQPPPTPTPAPTP